MEIVVYALIFWFLFSLYFFFKKRVTKKEAAFVFLIANFINTNIFVLFSDNFSLLTLSKDPRTYITFLFARSVIVPYVYLLFVCFLYRAGTLMGKSAIWITFFAILLGLDKMSSLLGLFAYKKWGLVILVSYHAVLMFVVWCMLRWFRKRGERLDV